MSKDGYQTPQVGRGASRGMEVPETRVRWNGGANREEPYAIVCQSRITAGGIRADGIPYGPYQASSWVPSAADEERRKQATATAEAISIARRKREAGRRGDKERAARQLEETK